MVHHVPENAWGISPIQKKHTNNVIFMTPLGHGHCHRFKNGMFPASNIDNKAPEMRVFFALVQGPGMGKPREIRQEFDDFPRQLSLFGDFTACHV